MPMGSFTRVPDLVMMPGVYLSGIKVPKFDVVDVAVLNIHVADDAALLERYPFIFPPRGARRQPSGHVFCDGGNVVLVDFIFKM
jgi:hypothetical protein